MEQNMTLREMQADLLKKLYEHTMAELKTAETHEDAIDMLREVANVFGFSLHRMEV